MAPMPSFARLPPSPVMVGVSECVAQKPFATLLVHPASDRLTRSPACEDAPRMPSETGVRGASASGVAQRTRCEKAHSTPRVIRAVRLRIRIDKSPEGLEYRLVSIFLIAESQISFQV